MTDDTSAPGAPFRETARRLARRYLLFVLAGFVVSAAASAGLFVSQRAWIGDCDGSGYSEEYYLAWCGSAKFQDYEHGAVYYDLEDGVVERLRAAEVLFLGNSLAQTAFSSDALEAFFRDRGLPYYLMGFGHGEQDRFAAAVIERFDLRPLAVVVNADHFFYDNQTGVGTLVTSQSALAILEYHAKRILQPIHRRVCSGGGSWLEPALCGTEGTIYRSRRTGRWQYRSFPVDREIAIELADGIPPATRERLPRMIEIARRFKQFIADRGGCLIVTSVPSDGLAPEAVREIARRAGLMSALPDPAGLATWDGGHLNRRSVELFSRRLAVQLGPLLDRCRAAHDAAKSRR